MKGKHEEVDHGFRRNSKKIWQENERRHIRKRGSPVESEGFRVIVDGKLANKREDGGKWRGLWRTISVMNSSTFFGGK